MGIRGQELETSSNFERWVELQREMQSALEARLHRELDDEPPFLVRYRERFEREFPLWSGAHISPRKLTENLRDSDFILVGDFHSLRQSQRTALRVLRRIYRQGARPAIAMEMIPTSAQSVVDAWLDGEIGDRRFRRLAEEEQWWDFPWEPVETLLRFAKRRNLPVIALNSHPVSRERGLSQRDNHAAATLADFRQREPNRPVMVLIGDFHLAKGHLPRALKRALKKRGLEARQRRIFQNHEPLYWESIRRTGRCHEILELAGGDFCIQSATPQVKLRSYLYWLTFHELQGSDDIESLLFDPSLLQEDVSFEVDSAMKRIAHFLKIPLLERGSPRVYWLGQENFALHIDREVDLSPDEIAMIEGCLNQGMDCYLPGRDLGVLADLGQNHIMEMAARVLHGRTVKISQRPRSLADDFYLRVLNHSLVFLGSKILNPLRKSRDLSSMIRFLKDGKPETDRWQKRADLLIAYLQAEEHFLDTGQIEGFAPKFFSLDGPAHLELTRAVGRNLGGHLYEALISDKLDRFWLRELWFESFNLQGSPVRCYFECLEVLGADPGIRLHHQTERL